MDLIEKKEIENLLHELLIEHGSKNNDKAYLLIDKIQGLVKELPTYSVSGLFPEKEICKIIQSYAEGAPSNAIIMDRLNNKR